MPESSPTLPFFDRSLLRPALFEFVVLADTHYMIDPGDRPLEFESRRRQTERAGVALKTAAALQPAFAVHMGDLVQEYPGTADFERALDEALAQIAGCGPGDVKFVAGNHDIGDKAGPIMPTAAVGERPLAVYGGHLGGGGGRKTWYSFDQGDVHFVVLNSQILNTTLPSAVEQQKWLEDDLASHGGRRTVVLLHLPPYLKHPGEDSLGHYDNVDEPARSWLLDLVRKFRVERLFAAHVHFSFCDLIPREGDGAGEFCRYRIAPSTSFTRPGFGHLFTSGPPAERGRDDVAKLGILLCRVVDEGIDVHLVRTHGAGGREAFFFTEKPAASRLLTPVPRPVDLAATGQGRITAQEEGWHNRLAITAIHPLAPTAQVPVAYPSVVRQSVRNDYPLLACLELGAGAVRVPGGDVRDAEQNSRLQLLRCEGVAVVATELWSPDAASRLSACGEAADAMEIQLPGVAQPPDDCLDWLESGRSEVPVGLCAVIAGEVVAGKQHPRTRIGYLPEELADLDRRLAQRGARVDTAVCRMDSPVASVETVRGLRLNAIGRVAFRFELPDEDDAHCAAAAAEALFAAASLGESRLYVEPLIDLDRTLDVRHGLLDTLCNPRPVFDVLRCLNAILADALEPGGGGGVELHAESDRDDWRVLRMQTSGTVLVLLSPSPAGQGTPPDEIALTEELLSTASGRQALHLYDLAAGTVVDVNARTVDAVRVRGPALVRHETDPI